MSTNWLRPQDFVLPDPQVNMAEYMLAFAIRSALMNAGLNFLSATPDPQFTDPQSYLESLISYAFSLTQNNFPVPYAPKNWNPAKAAFLWNDTLVAWLKRLPVNLGDPQTNNVYDAWVSHLGQYYGGHLPNATGTVTVTGDGTNTTTGPSAGPGGILGGGTR